MTSAAHVLHAENALSGIVNGGERDRLAYLIERIERQRGQLFRAPTLQESDLEWAVAEIQRLRALVGEAVE